MNWPTPLKLMVPLLILAAAELAFRCGVWEPLARPNSHTGTSVRVKNALLHPDMKRIDFVTLGSSRPGYGIDHVAIAAAARTRGLVHAGVTMPGTHWMTIGVMADWLAREHPEIRGGIIALSIADFNYAGNSSYELNIVQPFLRISLLPELKRHVAFDRNSFETWALYSSLFAYRTDMQDLLRHPQERYAEIRYFAGHTPQQMLFANADSDEVLCALPVGTLDDCALAANGSNDPKIQNLLFQCESVRNLALSRQDYSKLDMQALPAHLAQMRDVVRDRLRNLTWKIPAVIILMPVPRVLESHGFNIGQHALVRHVLAPLVEEGRIRLLDYNDFFHDDADGGCSAFFDFYHQNRSGRARLHERLLQEIERLLYGGLSPLGNST